LYELAVDEAPGLVSKKYITSAEHKLTMYSLYKQIEEGDAPLEISEDMDETKFRAWSQQRKKA